MSVVSDFFSQMESREAAQQSSSSGNSSNAPQEVAGSLLDLCYKGTRGTSILRPIMDPSMPMREINEAFDLYEVFPLLNPDGTQKSGEDGRGWVTSKHTFVMGTSNYRIPLTPEQMALHNALIQAIQDYQRLVEEDELIDPDNPAHGIDTKLRVNRRWKITMFWAKVLSLTVPGEGCIISDGEVRLCRHHGSSFRQDVANSIKGRTQMKGNDGSWQDAFFNRNVGPANAVMSINVVQQQGFKNTIQFEDFGPQYNITDKDIAIAGDLFAQGDNPSRPWIVGLNAMAYPHSEMQDTYDRITKYLNAFRARTGGGVQQPAAAFPQTTAPVAPVAQSVAPATMTATNNVVPPPAQPGVAQYAPQPMAQPIAQPVAPQAMAPQYAAPPQAPVYQQPPVVDPAQPMAQPVAPQYVAPPVQNAVPQVTTI